MSFNAIREGIHTLIPGDLQMHPTTELCQDSMLVFPTWVLKTFQFVALGLKILSNFFRALKVFIL